MNVFCKTALACAIASTTVAANAAEPLKVYGKLNISAQSNDVSGDRMTTIQSNSSRFGVKGGMKISSALDTFYMIEYGVDTSNDSSDNFTARNQLIGLKGAFGSFAVGRNDTVLKLSQGNVDQFNDLSGDLGALFNGENRLAQTATYLSPVISGFVLGATYVADSDGNQQGQNGFSLAAMFGDAKLKKLPFYVGLAYDADIKGYKTVRTTVQGKIMDVTLGGMYQTQEMTYSNSVAVTNDSTNGYLLNAAYDLANVKLKVQYQDMDELGNSWSIGGDYMLAKPTKAFAFYTSRSLDASTDDDKYLGVGIVHNF